MQKNLSEKMRILEKFFENNRFFHQYKKNDLSKFLIFKWDLFEE